MQISESLQHSSVLIFSEDRVQKWQWNKRFNERLMLHSCLTHSFLPSSWGPALLTFILSLLLNAFSVITLFTLLYGWLVDVVLANRMSLSFFSFLAALQWFLMFAKSFLMPPSPYPCVLYSYITVAINVLLLLLLYGCLYVDMLCSPFGSFLCTLRYSNVLCLVSLINPIPIELNLTHHPLTLSLLTLCLSLSCHALKPRIFLLSLKSLISPYTSDPEL